MAMDWSPEDDPFEAANHDSGYSEHASISTPKEDNLLFVPQGSPTPALSMDGHFQALDGVSEKTQARSIHNLDGKKKSLDSGEGRSQLGKRSEPDRAEEDDAQPPNQDRQRQGSQADSEQSSDDSGSVKDKDIEVFRAKKEEYRKLVDAGKCDNKVQKNFERAQRKCQRILNKKRKDDELSEEWKLFIADKEIEYETMAELRMRNEYTAMKSAFDTNKEPSERKRKSSSPKEAPATEQGPSPKKAKRASEVSSRKSQTKKGIEDTRWLGKGARRGVNAYKPKTALITDHFKSGQATKPVPGVASRQPPPSANEVSFPSGQAGRATGPPPFSANEHTQQNTVGTPSCSRVTSAAASAQGKESNESNEGGDKPRLIMRFPLKKRLPTTIDTVADGESADVTSKSAPDETTRSRDEPATNAPPSNGLDIASTALLAPLPVRSPAPQAAKVQTVLVRYSPKGVPGVTPLKITRPLRVHADLTSTSNTQASIENVKALEFLIEANARSNEENMSIKKDQADLKRARRFYSRGNKPIFNPQNDPDRPWELPRMACFLSNHQYLTVAAMLWRELSGVPNEPKGGILADEMGLGKTIMMLSLIVDNRPNKEALAQGMRSTLVVVKNSLLAKQFQEELNNRVVEKHRPRDIIYDGNARKSKFWTPKELRDRGVVITTYEEVQISHGGNAVIPDNLDDDAKLAWFNGHWKASRGVLHQIPWYRVILDECQVIKNHKTKTSIACRSLMFNHPWLVTGTPLVDSQKETYPMMKFLKWDVAGDWPTFRNNYCNPADPYHSLRLNCTLNAFMFRRRTFDKILGVPVQQLPESTARIIKLEIPVDGPEYKLQQIIIRKAKAESESSGNKKAKTAAILKMIITLRSALSHPLAIQAFIKSLDRASLEELRNSFRKLPHMDQRYPNNIRNMQKQFFEKSEDSEPLDGGLFGCAVHFNTYLDTIVPAQPAALPTVAITCSKCHQPPTNPFTNHCGHVLCGVCNLMIVKGARKRNMHAPCPHPECIMTLELTSSAKVFPEKTTGKSKASKGPKNDKSSTPNWLNFGGDGVMASTKCLAMKCQVLQWLEKDPDGKIIIFTQFISMVTILEKICNQEGWKCVFMHGDTSPTARAQAIQNFREDPDVIILISTMGVGGVGLNLTIASRVLLMEPWWNLAMEQQAFSRVYRIGQTKESECVKLIVKETVDEHVIDKQGFKDEAITMAISREMIHDITDQEMSTLFNESERPDDGVPFEMPVVSEIPERFLKDAGVDGDNGYDSDEAEEGDEPIQNA